MSELEEKLNSILGNPQMMAQIMSMAQNFSQPPQPSPAPGIDPSQLSGIMDMAKSLNIDSDQQRLLHALEPYLGCRHLQKLEKAMQAAKLADLTENALRAQQTGR